MYETLGALSNVASRMLALPEQWVLFADWADLAFGCAGLVLLVLLTIWWRQQSRWWPWVLLGTLALALLMSAASLYIFVVPAHYVGCPQGCNGWLGYPLPFAAVDFAGQRRLAPVDFGLNSLLLWLFWLVATVTGRLTAGAVDWPRRTRRERLALVCLLVLLPWAIVPRFLEPPQPRLGGEDLRLAINAQRIAQYTYSITGLWVQRLAVEDIRRLDSGSVASVGGASTTQVCLRGYSYFYMPWRRYRMILDNSGVIALNLTELQLDQLCW